MLWLSSLLVFGSLGWFVLAAAGTGLPPGHEDIAFPTAILVDEAGIARWIYQSDTYRQRARPEAIFAAIDALKLGG